MKGVYMFSDFKPFAKEIIVQLGIPDNQVISTQTFERENNYHDWLKDIFKNNEVEKILIPLNLNTNDPINDGLKIALHIRLNYELPVIKRIVPIIFLSDFTLDVIIRNNDFDPIINPQNLFFTQCIFLSSFDPDEIKNLIKKVEPCEENEYHFGILNKLRITQRASVGKHSISNAWGCFKLAQVTGLRDEIYKNENVAEHLKTFYAKYLICYNDVFTNEKFIDLNPMQCHGKKILFIDDQAEDGWSILMKNIFKSAGNDFQAIDSSNYKNNETKLFHDFEGFYAECQNQIGKDWDLIIMDLRLYPEREDIDSEMILPTELSGYKLIDEFLNENEGYQIIVSTASNKIWNINAALKRGASSYYIKESPEFSYAIRETKRQYEDFKNDVQNCFQRNYLKVIWNETKNCKNHLVNLLQTKKLDKTFVDAIITFLDLGFDTLNNHSGKYPFDSAFMYYFLILEASAKEMIDEDNPQKVAVTTVIGTNITGYKFIFRKTGKPLIEFAGNSFLQTNIGDELISQTKRAPYDPKFHNLIANANVAGINPVSLVKLRNDFSHPDLVNNRRIAQINKENVIDIFKTVKSLINNFNQMQL